MGQTATTSYLTAEFVPYNSTMRYTTKLARRVAFNFAYARYSSATQHESSIDRQFAVTDESAVEFLNGQINERFFDEAISGATTSRAGIDALILKCQESPGSNVFVEDIDRFIRDWPAFWVVFGALRACQTNIYDTSGLVTDDRLFREGERAVEVRTKLKSRTIKHTIRAILSGGYVGSVPYGLVAAGKHKVQLDPKAAEAARLMFELYADGGSGADIALSLHERGYRSAKGGTFSGHGITHLLHNRIYIGQRHTVFKRNKQSDDAIRQFGTVPEGTAIYVSDEYIRIVVQTPHTRIVSDELWMRVRARDRGQYSGLRQGRLDFVLGGKIKCPCGGTYVVCSGQGLDRGMGCRENRDHRCNNDQALSMRWLEQQAIDGIERALAIDFESFHQQVVKDYDSRSGEKGRSAEELDFEIKRLEQELVNMSQLDISTPAAREVVQRKMDETGRQIDTQMALRAQVKASSFPPPKDPFPSSPELFDELRLLAPLKPVKEVHRLAFAMIQGMIAEVNVNGEGASREVVFTYDFSKQLRSAPGTYTAIHRAQVTDASLCRRERVCELLASPGGLDRVRLTEGEKERFLSDPDIKGALDMQPGVEAVTLLNTAVLDVLADLGSRRSAGAFSFDVESLKLFQSDLAELGLREKFVSMIRQTRSVARKTLHPARRPPRLYHQLRLRGNPFIHLSMCDPNNPRGHKLLDSEYELLQPYLLGVKRFEVDLIFKAVRHQLDLTNGNAAFWELYVSGRFEKIARLLCAREGIEIPLSYTFLPIYPNGGSRSARSLKALGHRREAKARPAPPDTR